MKISFVDGIRYFFSSGYRLESCLQHPYNKAKSWNWSWAVSKRYRQSMYQSPVYRISHLTDDCVWWTHSRNIQATYHSGDISSDSERMFSTQCRHTSFRYPSLCWCSTSPIPGRYIAIEQHWLYLLVGTVKSLYLRRISNVSGSLILPLGRWKTVRCSSGL